jgi:hypothetical protein
VPWCFAFRQGGDGFHHLFQGQLLGHFGIHILRDLGGYVIATLPLDFCNVRGMRFKCVQVGVKLGDIMGEVRLFVYCHPVNFQFFQEGPFFIDMVEVKE